MARAPSVSNILKSKVGATARPGMPKTPPGKPGPHDPEPQAPPVTKLKKPVPGSGTIHYPKPKDPEIGRSIRKTGLRTYASQIR